MKRSLCLLGAALSLALAPSPGAGQVLLGPTLAWHDDADLGIGATVGLEIPSIASAVGFLGDFLIFFPDGSDYFELNGNVTYDFSPLPESTAVPFVLAGLNLGHSSADTPLGDVSDTDLSLNLGGGIAFNAGRFRPKAAGRLVLGNGTSLVLFVTLPFRMGPA